MKKFNLFIDESGDHGLSNVNEDFPVFVLCGVLISNEELLKFNENFNNLKRKFWSDKKVIFHSREIRKCDKEFQILLDLNIKSKFYENLNKLIEDTNFIIIAIIINKINHIKKYGKLSDDVYEISLSSLIDKTIGYLQSQQNIDKLNIIIEKRGRKEDKKLDDHFQKLCSLGTNNFNSEILKKYSLNIKFLNKSDDINGLQLADLCAYPIARYSIDPMRSNPSFELIQEKILRKDSKNLTIIE